MKKVNKEHIDYFRLGKNYKQDAIFREGDLVKVIKPELFVRCGYPMTLESAYKKACAKYGEAVNKFLNELDNLDFDGVVSSEHLKIPITDYCYTDKEPIMDVLAQRYIKMNGFGGKERRIHTETNPNAKGRIYRIISRFTCKTGDYFSSSSSYDAYNGGYDYEPGGLENEKTHIILNLADGIYRWNTTGDITIEANNVNKIHGHKNWEICKFICNKRNSDYFTSSMYNKWKYCDEENCNYKLEHEVIGQKNKEEII